MGLGSETWSEGVGGRECADGRESWSRGGRVMENGGCASGMGMGMGIGSGVHREEAEVGEVGSFCGESEVGEGAESR